MSKEVAKKGGNAVIPDYGEHAGSGFEGTTAADLSIPFIALLQNNSPQVENDDPKGSKPGMLFNTVTQELVDGEKGLVFLPVSRKQAYVEWITRDEGGGLVAVHEPDSEFVRAALKENPGGFGKMKVDGHDLVQTYYFYGLLLDEKGEKPDGFAVISFTSTKIKPQRDWWTAMQMVGKNIPLWAFRSRVTSVKQKNTKGTFFNFRISPFGDTWRDDLVKPDSELFTAAVNFRDMVESGAAKADFSNQNAAGDEADDEKPPF